MTTAPSASDGASQASHRHAGGSYSRGFKSRASVVVKRWLSAGVLPLTFTDWTTRAGPRQVALPHNQAPFCSAARRQKGGTRGQMIYDSASSRLDRGVQGRLRCERKHQHQHTKQSFMSCNHRRARGPTQKISDALLELSLW